MGSKQDDHNRGERDGSKASGFDAWVDLNNPLNPEEYKSGYRHGLQQQRERKASVPDREETSKSISGLAGLGAPIGGWVGGGGGGGGGGGSISGWGALVILILVIGVPAGMFIQWKEKRDAIAALGTAKMTISTNSNPSYDTGVVPYDHATPQSLVLFVSWSGSIYKSQRPLRIILEHEGGVQYDHSWQHDDLDFNKFGVKIQGNFPVGRYTARALVEGTPPAEYGFLVVSRPPGEIFVSDTLVIGWPRGIITTLHHQPGEKQKIFIGVGLKGTILSDARLVYVGLFHDGEPLFNTSYRVTEQNRNFYLPFESDFSEGSYTARLSADGDPPAEFSFSVETSSPLQRSQEEKNQDAAALVDRILPGGGQSNTHNSSAANTEAVRASSQDSVPPQTQVRNQFSDCYSGTWHQNESNRFTWNFRRAGSYLQISRTDGFVSGQFQKSSDGWTGILNWRNGTRWNGVILHDANEACDEITTNQRWWYKR